MKNTLAVLGICASCLFSQTAMAAVVTGSGTDSQEALKDAMRVAVEQTIGTLVKSETRIESSIVIEDEILAKSQGYVRDYKILETFQQNGSVFVKADVDVAAEPDSALMKTLDTLMLLDDPRIVVLITENNNTNYLDNQTCETKLAQALLDAGYKRVNEGHVLAAQRGIKISSNNSSELVSVAKNLDADYLVMGTVNGDSTSDIAATTGAGEGKSGLRTFNSTLDYKVVKVDTAQVITAGSTKGVGLELTPSVGMQSAYLKAADDAAEQIIAGLQTEATVVNKNVTLTCKVRGYSEVEQLKKDLGGISGVNGVYVRSYQNGNAVIEVDYAKSAASLLNDLQRRSRLSLNVSKSTLSSIDLSVK